MITRRENMLKVFRHEEPEWVPITTVSDNYNKPRGMPPGYFEGIEGLDGTLALARYLDIEIWARASAYVEKYRNVEYTKTVEGDIRTERWDTPYGVLTARYKKVEFSSPIEGDPGVSSWAPCEWPVKAMTDYRAFSYIIENLDYEFHPDLVSAQMDNLGDRGILAVSAPDSPLMACAQRYMGVEALGFAYHDYPHKLRDLLALLANKHLEAYRGIAQTVGDAAINYDNTTTFAISPAMFRELSVPYLNQTADIMHAQGKFLIHHACGHVLALLKDLSGTRADVLDGPYAPPAGDSPVDQARERLGPDMVMTLPTDDLTIQSGDPVAIRRYIRRMFEQAGSHRNLIICVVPPPAIPVGNLWLAIDEAKKWSHQLPRP